MAIYGRGPARGHITAALIGAVIFGCALFVPAIGAADGITVTIIKLDKNPIVFDAGKEHEFEAVAVVEGQELPGGEVTWDWNFGDNTPHSADNPTTHIYTDYGDTYHVVVTATYGNLSGQAELNAQAAAPGTEEVKSSMSFTARAGGPNDPAFGSQVCDETSLVVQVPQAELDKTSFMLDAVQFERHTDMGWWPDVQIPSWLFQHATVNGQDVLWCSTDWPTCYDKNDIDVSWRVQVTADVLGGGGPICQSWYLDPQSWSPKNTVVTGMQDPIYQESEGRPALSWSLQHVDMGSPTFDITVDLYPLSPGTVKRSLEFKAQPLSSSGASWPSNADPLLPGLYASRVYANHWTACDDADKVDGLLFIDDVGGELDVPTLVYHLHVHYHVARAITAAALDVYNCPELSRRCSKELGDVSSSGTADIDIQMTSDDINKTLSIVFSGEEADGSGNRDQKPKPCVATSVAHCLPCPSALYVWGSADTNAGWGEITYPDTSKVASSTQAPDSQGRIYRYDGEGSDAEIFRDSLKRSAIATVYAHAASDTLYIGGSYTHDRVQVALQAGGVSDNPAQHIYYVENFGSAPRCHLLILAGCNTANPAPQYHTFLSQFHDLGIECVMGFKREIFWGGMADFVERLTKLLHEGDGSGGPYTSVKAAAQRVLADENSSYTLNELIGFSGDTQVRPACWGGG